MTEERKRQCRECFTTETVRLMLSPIQETVGTFLDNFNKRMIDIYGSCTEEDTDFAFELLEDWQKKNNE